MGALRLATLAACRLLVRKKGRCSLSPQPSPIEVEGFMPQLHPRPRLVVRIVVRLVRGLVLRKVRLCFHI